jgi:hypothetical protein
LDLALRSEAATLGQAIAEYEGHFNVKVTPMTKPLYGIAENVGKYFDCREPKTGMQWIVDIHVFRGGEELCPKQDLQFHLLAEDIVEMGELIC